MNKTYIIILVSVCILGMQFHCKAPEKNGDLTVKQKELSDLKQKVQKLENEIAAIEQKSSGKKERTRLVTVDTLGLKSFTHYIDILGMVSGDDVIHVNPSMPGTINQVNVHAGQQVQAGQILAVMDDAVINQGLAELQSQVDFAKDLYQRQKALWDQKIGSEVQYLSAKNNLEAIEKRLATSREQWAMTRIKAPVSGVIDEVFAKVGGSTAPGVPVVRLVNKSKTKIKGAAAESYAGIIRNGQKVLIEFPDIQKKAESKITYVGSVIDPVNRTFMLEAALPGGGNYLPNMVAVIKVADYTTGKAIIIPVNLLQRDTRGEYVFIAESTQGVLRSKKVYVTTGKIYGDAAEITQGLKHGQLLVTTGFQTLNDQEALTL